MVDLFRPAKILSPADSQNLGTVEDGSSWMLVVPVSACKHGRYDAHWIGGPCHCYETHPITGEKGRWKDGGFEYSEVVWAGCDHEWCHGAGIAE